MAKSSFEGFPQPRPNGGGMKTGDATAAAGDIVVSKFAYGPSGKIIGTLPDNGANSFNPSTAAQPIPLGKYNGSGVVNPVTGNAAVGDVKSGQGFSSGNGIGLTGTMPVRSGDTAALSSAVSGTTLRLRASDGYRDGTNDFVTITDADWIAANIPLSLDIFGLVGTGTNAKRTASGTLSSSAGSVTYKDNAGVNKNFPSLIVSGLSFKPSVIYIFRPAVASGDWAIYTETNDGVYTKHIYLCDLSPTSGFSTSTTQYSIKGDVAPASVVNGSFQLPVNFGSTSYTWIAYE